MAEEASVATDPTPHDHLLCFAASAGGRGVCECINHDNIHLFAQLYSDFHALKKSERAQFVHDVVASCCSPRMTIEGPQGLQQVSAKGNRFLRGIKVCRSRFEYVVGVSHNTVTNVMRRFDGSFKPHKVHARTAALGSERDSPHITVQAITQIAEMEGLEFPDKRGRVYNGRPTVHIRTSRKELYRLYKRIFPDVVHHMAFNNQLQNPDVSKHQPVYLKTFLRALKHRVKWVKLSFARTDDCDQCER